MARRPPPTTPREICVASLQTPLVLALPTRQQPLACCARQPPNRPLGHLPGPLPRPAQPTPDRAQVHSAAISMLRTGLPYLSAAVPIHAIPIATSEAAVQFNRFFAQRCGLGLPSHPSTRPSAAPLGKKSSAVFAQRCGLGLPSHPSTRPSAAPLGKKSSAVRCGLGLPSHPSTRPSAAPLGKKSSAVTDSLPSAAA